MKTHTLYYTIFLFSLLALFADTATAAAAPELPEGNLIVNPWFRDASNTGGSHDGWIPGELWGLSQKTHNPTPDEIKGTAVRLGTPKATFGVDSFVHTVVAADRDKKILRFQTWQVSRNLHEEYVTIYGSDSEEGPWTQVWKPWIETNSSVHWIQVPLVEKQLEEGFPFYKVEFMCNYGSGTAGCKYTGVYFTASGSSDSNAVGETVRPQSGSNGRGQGAATQAAGNGFALTVTAVTENEITLSWDETFADGTELFIERSADGRRDWEQLGVADLLENSYSDFDLESNTAYFYRLQGQSEVSSQGSGGRLRSIVASATTLPVDIVPSPTAVATVAATAESVAELPSSTPQPVEPAAVAAATQVPATPMLENEAQAKAEPEWAGSLLSFLIGMLLMGLLAWLLLRRRTP